MPRVAGALVTEADLNGQFTPKPGHTPGTDDTILLDCATITDRYYVDIDNYVAGRLPSWDELSATGTEYTFRVDTDQDSYNGYPLAVARVKQGEVLSAEVPFPNNPGFSNTPYIRITGAPLQIGTSNPWSGALTVNISAFYATSWHNIRIYTHPANTPGYMWTDIPVESTDIRAYLIF